MAHSAFKMLSMYSDSDDEDASPSTSENKRLSSEENLVKTRVHYHQETTIVTKSFDIAPIEPHAHHNLGDNQEPQTNTSQPDEERQRRTSEWASDDELFQDLNDEPNGSLYNNSNYNFDSTKNDDEEIGEEEEREEEEPLSPREPPPPARPEDPRLCSPSPAGVAFARSPTPAKRLKPAQATPVDDNLDGRKIPRIESGLLVAYDEAEDDEVDEYQRRISRGAESRHSGHQDLNIDHDDQRHLKLEESGASAEQSDKTAENTPAAVEDLDSYALLERCLEKEAAPGDSPITTEAEIDLPPSPKEKCDPELAERFSEYMRQKKQHGRDFNRDIQRRKDFRNPSIYEKLIEHFQLDELGSNFKPALFDPHGFKPTDYVDELMKAQRLIMDKLEKDKNAKDGASAASLGSGSADNKPRRSKWDNPHAATDAASRAAVRK